MSITISSGRCESGPRCFAVASGAEDGIVRGDNIPSGNFDDEANAGCDAASVVAAVLVDHVVWEDDLGWLTCLTSGGPSALPLPLRADDRDARAASSNCSAADRANTLSAEDNIVVQGYPVAGKETCGRNESQSSCSDSDRGVTVAG